MTLAENPRAQPGGNLPPDTALDDLKVRVDQRVKGANEWLASLADSELPDAEHAKRMEDFLGQLVAESRAVEEERKRRNDPHRTEIDKNNLTFKNLLAPIEKAIALLKPLKERWLKRERERLAEAEHKAAVARLEAQKREAEAQLQAPATVQGALAAEQVTAAREDAEAAERAAQKAKPQVRGDFTARASGLRTVWGAQIEQYQMALEYYGNYVEVREAVQRLANADARDKEKRKGKVPGVRWVSKEVV